MQKKDITEIKRRLKRESCLPRKVSGCCVSTNKEILTTFHTFFGNLDEKDRTKYLEIAGKVLSGKIGNNALELTFPNEAEFEGGTQYQLLRLRDSDLEDEALKAEFFNKIIESYKSDKEYVIFLFHDVYDVMDKTSDNQKLDESSSQFDYLLCAICPLEESKPGLIYSHAEQVIKERIRDWVVTDPEVGFIFPAFTERETDVHAVLYHVKNPVETQEDLANCLLGCEMIQTSLDKKEVFTEIINEALGEEENVGRLVYNINESLRDMIEVKKEVLDPETGEVTGHRVEKADVEVSKSVLQAVLEENEIQEDKIEVIQKAVEQGMTGSTSVDQIIDRKLLEKEKHSRREEELLLEINRLKEENLELKRQIKELMNQQ